MVYRPGQARRMFPYLKDPEWLLLGGPADADEAQCFAARYPGIKIVAVEPDPRMVRWQKENGFPAGTLVEAALWDSCGADEIVLTEGGRRSSMIRPVTGERVPVKTVTLDSLSAELGPFTRAVLWLDVEGAERRALAGAAGLFDAGAVDAVLVEVTAGERPEDQRVVAEFLEGHGLKAAGGWGDKGTFYNAVYVRQ
jgi:FkbM family methyltransferase